MQSTCLQDLKGCGLLIWTDAVDIDNIFEAYSAAGESDECNEDHHKLATTVKGVETILWKIYCYIV